MKPPTKGWGAWSNSQFITADAAGWMHWKHHAEAGERQSGILVQSRVDSVRILPPQHAEDAVEG